MKAKPFQKGKSRKVATRKPGEKVLSDTPFIPPE
jgi:hypothetical protein